MQTLVIDAPANTYLASRHRATIPQIPEIARTAIDGVIEAAKASGLEFAGPCTFLYDGADGNPATEFDLLIAFPIASKPAGAPAGFEIVDAPAFHCLAVDYVGPMSNIMAGYEALMTAIREQRLTPTWKSREVYKHWIQPESPENVTELQIGIS